MKKIIKHIFLSSFFGARVYYFFFNPIFNSETLALKEGTKEFNRNLVNYGKTSSMLRRNIHRIEKGLIMKNKRSFFAEGYIDKTLSILEDVSDLKDYSREELQWAFQVLEEFFNECNGSDVIETASKKFLKLQKKFISNDVEVFIPQKLKKYETGSINFSVLNEFMSNRKSVRWFRDEDVDKQKVIAAINSSTSAPSACNRIPYKFYTSFNKSTVKKIADCAGGASTFSHNIPCIMAITGDLSFYEYERDRHLIYIDSSLAAMQLILALKSLGMHTCTINWPDDSKKDKAIRKLIPLKKFERVTMLLAIGHGDLQEKTPYSQKKDSSLVFEEIN